MRLLFLLLFVGIISCEKVQYLPHTLFDRAPLSSNVMKVVTFKGQSNMCGRAKTGYNTALLADAYILSYNTRAKDSFQLMRKGVNTADKAPYFGIQYMMAEQRKGYYFQPAFGGQPISAWDEGKFMWDYTVKGVNYIKSYAQSKGKRAEFTYAVFYQGETDATQPTFDSAAYRKKMENLFSRYRKLTGNNVKFIIIQFPMCYMNIKDHMAQIRDVQYRVSKQPNNYLIPLSADDKCLDKLHITEETLRRKTEEILKIIK